MRENSGTREKRLFLLEVLVGFIYSALGFLNGLSYSQKSVFISLLILIPPAMKITATNVERHLLCVESRHPNSLPDWVVQWLLSFLCALHSAFYTHTHTHTNLSIIRAIIWGRNSKMIIPILQMRKLSHRGVMQIVYDPWVRFRSAIPDSSDSQLMCC